MYIYHLFVQLKAENYYGLIFSSIYHCAVVSQNLHDNNSKLIVLYNRIWHKYNKGIDFDLKYCSIFRTELETWLGNYLGTHGMSRFHTQKRNYCLMFLLEKWGPELAFVFWAHINIYICCKYVIDLTLKNTSKTSQHVFP